MFVLKTEFRIDFFALEFEERIKRGEINLTTINQLIKQ